MPPPLPVTVTAAAPSVAVLDAESVRTLLFPAAGLELKLAVTPPGKTPVPNVMALVKPPVRVMVIVLAPLAPRLTVRFEGEADNVKSGGGGALTVRLRVVERESPPPEPLIVTLTVPVAAVLEAASVRALLPPVVEGGLKVAVTPLGNPVALKATLLVNPPLRVMVIVLAPLPPRLMVRLGGLADSVKFGLPPGPCHVRKTLSAGLDRGL